MISSSKKIIISQRIASKVLARKVSRYIREAAKITSEAVIDVIVGDLKPLGSNPSAKEIIEFTQKNEKLVRQLPKGPTSLWRFIKDRSVQQKVMALIREGNLVPKEAEPELQKKVYGLQIHFRERGGSSYFSSLHTITIEVNPKYASSSDTWFYYLEQLKSIFLHEFIHAIDFSRGNPEPYGEEVRKDKSLYLTHQLEVNARIQETMAKYDRKLLKEVEKTLRDSDDLIFDLGGLLGRTTKREMEDIYYSLDTRLVKELDKNPELKKKVTSRLYSEIEEFKDSLRNRSDIKKILKDREDYRRPLRFQD